MRFLANMFIAKRNFFSSSHKTTYLASVSVSSGSKALLMSVGYLSILANICNISSVFALLKSGHLDAGRYLQQQTVINKCGDHLDSPAKTCLQEWLNQKITLNQRKNLLLGLEIFGNCIAVVGTICSLSGVGLPISLVLGAIGFVIGIVSVLVRYLTELQDREMDGVNAAAITETQRAFRFSDMNADAEITRLSRRVSDCQHAIAMAKICGLLQKALATQLRKNHYVPLCADQASTGNGWARRATELIAKLERQTHLLPSDIQVIRSHIDKVQALLCQETGQEQQRLIQLVQSNLQAMDIAVSDSLTEEVLVRITNQLLKYRHDYAIKQALASSGGKNHLTRNDLAVLCKKSQRADTLYQHYFAISLISQLKTNSKYLRQQVCEDMIDILSARKQALDADMETRARRTPTSE